MNGENTLLIEIGTEDLPPTRLDQLVTAFQNEILKRFKNLNLPYEKVECFASPRRLALKIQQVPVKQPDYVAQKRGPSLKAAYKNGEPTPAAIGFAQSCNTQVQDLKTLETEQGAWLLFEENISGKLLANILPGIIAESIESLPYPKKMRWGDSTLQFIRPIHWIALVHGNTAIEADILNIKSGQYSYGHRTHFPDKIKINHADNYLNVLRDVKVIVDYQERKNIIIEAAMQLAKKLQGTAVIDDTLLDQVVGLVEWPVPMVAQFSADFLKVPKEALISSMQNHQKCFPIISNDKLLPYFILVSNIEALDTKNIIMGNQRVMHARLEDAKFFYEKDCKSSLESRLERLDKMIYQQKLGTLRQKTQRVATLANRIAQQIKANADFAQRAAELYKADLVTNMVFEFPELQGIMGYYYAKNDQEAEEVATAIKEVYLPAHAKDTLPTTQTGICLALAERLDTLIGIFGAGLIPSGDKDPYALRRAAMGILRIIIEKKLTLNLQELLLATQQNFNGVVNKDVLPVVYKFCLERFKSWYQEQSIAPQVIEAVLSTEPQSPYDMSQRTLAVNHFKTLAEAQALAAANKRVKNILQKSEQVMSLENLAEVNHDLLKEAAEKELFLAISTLKGQTEPLLKAGQYQEALTLLATLKQPVDRFFDEVLVMVDDKDLKRNRVLLLTQLYALFMQIADISKLAI